MTDRQARSPGGERCTKALHTGREQRRQRGQRGWYYVILRVLVLCVLVLRALVLRALILRVLVLRVLAPRVLVQRDVKQRRNFEWPMAPRQMALGQQTTL